MTFNQQVLSILGGEQARGIVSDPEKSVKVETAPAVQLPDLIDTDDQDDYNGTDNSTTRPSDQNVSNLTQPKTPLIDDFFGDSLGSGATTRKQQMIDDDPFADVSFHTVEPKENVGDPFSGMMIDTKAADSGSTGGAVKSGPELFDIFGSTSETQKTDENQGKDVNNLMAGLSVNENLPMSKQEGTSSGVSSDAFHNVLASQSVGTNPNQAFPLGNMPYAIPPGMMLNPNFSSQPINYGAMGSFLAQQQLFATMNLQQLANLNAQNIGNSGHMVGTNGAYSSALPDVFQSSFQTQNPNSVTNGAKKEETRAFDFISVSYPYLYYTKVKFLHLRFVAKCEKYSQSWFHLCQGLFLFFSPLSLYVFVSLIAELSLYLLLTLLRCSMNLQQLPDDLRKEA